MESLGKSKDLVINFISQVNFAARR